MSTLRVCDGCGRHVRVRDEECPFCERPSKLARTATKAVAAAVTVAVGLSLSACYGGPPKRENIDRGKGDAWTAGEDSGPKAAPDQR